MRAHDCVVVISGYTTRSVIKPSFQTETHAGEERNDEIRRQILE